MPIAIRNADLKQDRDEIIYFLYENLTQQSSAQRFDWLYLQNPCGPARVSLAMDEANGRTIGVASAFPRDLLLDGDRRRGWVLGDFCISQQYRTLGPALALQRACLSSTADDNDTICFDFPSKVMVAVYSRLGLRKVGKLIRYTKLLRVDAKVRELVPNELAAQTVATVGNFALRVQRSFRRSRSDIEVSLYEGSFGEEFSSFDLHTAGTGLRTLHTADYLNWRYRNNPLCKYSVLVARRESDLLGYAILQIDGDTCILADLHAEEEAKTVPAILGYVDGLTRTLQIHTINAPIMEGSHFAPYLRSCGFYPREAEPVIVSSRSANSTPSVESAENWFLMHGDRES